MDELYTGKFESARKTEGENITLKIQQIERDDFHSCGKRGAVQVDKWLPFSCFQQHFLVKKLKVQFSLYGKQYIKGKLEKMTMSDIVRNERSWCKMKIVIAERDHYERTAVEWLISTYGISIDEVCVANNMQQLLNLLGKETPEILFVELDMIPIERFEDFNLTVQKGNTKIIAATAESTFERAKQAIELGSVELLVKPHDPVKIQASLRKALMLAKAQGTSPHTAPYLTEDESYRTLFTKDVKNNGDTALMLLQTENNRQTADLLLFLTNFPFRKAPLILPLTDAVVCLFQSPTHLLQEEGWKLSREWEAGSFAPLVSVLVPPNTDISTIHEMYLKARDLLQATFFLGYRQVIVHKENEELWYEMDPFLTSAEQREWVDMLNSFDKQQIKQWMHHEFLHMKSPFPNPELLRTRLTSILAQIRRFMKIYQLDQGEMEAAYMRIFSGILYNSVLYRIVQEMLLFLYDLLDHSKTGKVFSKKNAVEKGILYIERYYNDPDLSLEKVAEAAGKSPAYYSHLLSKKQGVPFRTLLANKRIKEAKQLLIATPLSIKEVAEQVGFRNQSYFTRLFKEQTKMAPREYRDYNRQSEKSALE
jgi:YesN/AraC family two-component response regulator